MDNIHSFHVRGHYSFLSLSFLSRGPLTESNYFPSYVGLHSTSSFTWVDPSGRACLGMPAHHACSTYVLSLHPRFNLWSRLLPITQFPCRSALSYQSKCRSVMHTLYLSITHFKLSISVSKNVNLGLHQYPLYDTKIKPNQLALNLSPPYNQTFFFLNQNTMLIIDNKALTSILYIVSIIKNLSIHHSPYSLFQTIQ